MNLATDTGFAGFLSALHSNPTDAATALVACDWLQEHGATLADVLALYAGAPPDWLSPTWDEDEALRRLLATWCEREEPYKLTPRRSFDLPDAVNFFRCDAVRRCEIIPVSLDVSHFAQPALGQVVKGIVTEMARRTQKRRVLSLFPDIVHERCFTIDLRTWREERYPERLLKDIEARMAEGGWRVDVGITITVDDQERRVVCKHRLAAPDWIPPETYGPSPLRDAYPTFRFMQTLDGQIICQFGEE